MGGLTSGKGGGLISRIVFLTFLLEDTWAYIQGLIKEGGGGIYTFCEHFESTYMVAALRSYSTKRGISLHSLSVSMCGLHTCQ